MSQTLEYGDAAPLLGHVDTAQAVEFIRAFHAEHRDAGSADTRIRSVLAEIDTTGTYWHTPAELAHGARVAWRNAARCIGRLYWHSLVVRDRRDVTTAERIADEAVTHLRLATNGGRIRPTISVFAPAGPLRPSPRIWNEQLVRYAGYPQPDGTVVGDPRNIALTELAASLGWQGRGGRFDVLPLVISAAEEPPRVFPLPQAAVLEVSITHPRLSWFADLELCWHAVPVLADMCLEIGGVRYPAAPFNGWYMCTEIGARNFADAARYNMLPTVARRMGLDTQSDRTLWRDRAIVELTAAVLHSFDAAGVTITDHHTESRRFLTHLEREQRARRLCPADWSWIVPPISGAATPVFHRYYDDVALSPAYVRPSEPH